MGEDPWIGCGDKFGLPLHMIQLLREILYLNLNQVLNISLISIWGQEWKHAGEITFRGEDANIWE